MKITTKIIIFSVGMLTVLALAITIPSSIISYRTQQKELVELEKSLRRDFDKTIEFEVQTVMSLLDGIYAKVASYEISVEEGKVQAADLVRKLRYGKDGYFWIDTKDGVNVVLLGKTDVEGKSRWDLKDAKGTLMIQEIVKSAVEGDGYTEYWFPKKGGTIALPKRSFSAYFKPFEWVVGTGNYIDDIDTSISKTRDEQMTNLRSSMLQTLIIAFVMLIVFGFLSVLFGRRITRSIISLSVNTESIASGDLSMQIKKTENDEIGVLQKSLALTLKKLKEVIEEVVEGSANVSAASEQMAQSAEHISTGANSQAASTEEISSSIEEMVSNVHSNSANAKRTAETAKKASNGIGQLKESVSNNLKAMQSISDKVNVIKDIALQTNLLALNASVEASRAGEAGRGFSVVAAEVRKLSEFTQKAAKEIDEESLTSLEIAQTSWSSMEAILPEINSIIDAIQEILTASNEQEAGANHINNAIQELVNITSQNSASSEEMASSSEELSRQAEHLQETISFFKTK
ncbi:methyl-accepting chemotaxis protein [Carboxylicivirga sp. N1Y90]|uniref:methyl-accepting chemotaxis protein n=1 Tax=Carboxylicivirga fragile TaxID=3417571 RepID=UPI003D34A5F3|nr:methyl-accepting chemotaxis protein [Marinilabiliaceae bacterium N1Y90]